ncbi:unnamed protein product [Microthlaspi erraticum]|uniref:DUF4218 domain-containing protein n=1 Tax=Microthlaspi erraticum TaxID=1685480 RepID=A0A6D2ISM2_9BRAS|nr:unnamed protein product [Microthlaspi erraticum]CAA7038277.1 unnamed protein product [Microthlaspi erraticum]
MLCPCRDCRNLCHQSVEEIVEHLVIRGMDKKYKTSCWSIHGEKRASTEDSGRRHETEAFELFKTAFSMNEGEPNQTNGNEALEANDDEAVEETQFKKKLREAETPLYSDFIKYTKVSAIMGLYRFKVKSGVSENYFDQLLDLIKDILPEDNVLPKSLATIKKILKIFGFGYQSIHACKNDCILYRKEFEKLDSCPRCKVSRWEKDKHSNEIKVGIPTKIPGPTAPGNNIDVYLAPLIDDLKDLWAEGIEVYDSFAKENFTLRAMLLWSISDYPALGTLSGCKVKGKQACNVCGKDTPSRWLKFSRKFVYMGNRKRLPPGHRYRYKKAWFDNTVEEGNAKRIQTGDEIYQTLQAFRNDFGKPLDKENKRKRAELEDDEVVQEEECEESNDLWRWKKRSIFFELPYWKDLPVRHNIDVMHVEKNVSDAILSILMQSAKSKDGLKARKDLEDIGIRNHLHTEVRGKKTYLPQQPIGYPRKRRPFSAKGSLKSHDHHVLVQNLLPAALRGLLHKGPRIAISRLCSYFNRLCQCIIDPEKLMTMETEFVETMCQLERFFPPSLFDIMFHLPIHLSKEARLGGPVHFRWMYPFERYMKTFKAFVKNHARPEACMAEGYLAGECVAFCLEFLKDSVPVQETVNRNEDIEADRSVIEGRPLQKGIEVTLSDKDRDTAHRYVLMNMASLNPYVEKHLEELQANDARCAKNETLLWKNHTEQFAQWLKIKIHSDSTNSHSKEIRWLAFGPRNVVVAHKGFIVNGQRFHTDAVKRKTQNSGVTYEAFSMCRSSARDMRQVTDILTYYGVIKEILLMDYHMFKVPLFRCNWANTGNGVKEEDGFTLVNLHMNQTAYLKDPFILPSQAKQVFYSREDDNSNWYVVMREPPRGYHELETEENLSGAPLPIQELDDLDDEACDNDSVYVRDDCEGLLVVD